MDHPHILLFDLYSGGHHLQYLQQLATYWVDHRLPGRLSIVVTPAFVAKHPGLQQYAARHADASLHLIPIEGAVHAEEGDASFARLVQYDREHGRLLKKYVARLQPDHCVLMYLDHAQLSLAFGLRFDRPVTLSGIYFRPSFHYAGFENRKPGPAERLQRFRKRQTLALALHNPHFTHLFCLDPYVVPHAEALEPRVAATFLPDGFTPRSGTQQRAQVREQWGIEEHRSVALFFGVVDGRKGIFQVLDAVQHLPASEQEALALVVSGPLDEQENTAIQAALQAVRTRTRVQLVTDTRFVPDAEIQGLFRGADLALVTYQQHIGSSNVLIRAAAEAVPVLGSDYGLVGEQIRRRRLGLAVDATAPEALARALHTFLENPGAFPYDAGAARSFAAENTAERYAATLLGTILTALESPLQRS